jgi:isoamylase
MAAVWDAIGRSWTVTLWSSVADAATVVIVDRADPQQQTHTFDMVRDGDGWTATVAAAAIGDADLYGFRVHGDAPGCDSSKFLLDPQAREVWFPPEHDRDAARVRGTDTLGTSPFGVLPMSGMRSATPAGPRHPLDQLVVYEVHVRGATMCDPGLNETMRGTFAALTLHAERIAALGITAIELLPVHQFDPAEGNYWGYMPLVWSALHDGYVSTDGLYGGAADDEFRAMVQTFHNRGIEVILDVVYNHTTEEDHDGPTFNLRAIDDAAYYVRNADGTYDDDSGCGNVVRAAHPAAGTLILDSLARFADLGVDGFRFDLGSLLGRDLDGHVQRNSELIDEITAFAVARDVRLICEPWDMAAYQIGDAFPGRTWAQWNGKFRDDCRSFLRAENGATEAFATRVLGSPDLFPDAPGRSINFVTAHDGFTVYDLVSYEHKRNQANGQNGHDGTDDNRSWNCGWEGDDMPEEAAAAVSALRLQQIKNAFVMLMLSAGVPMMLAGDEFAQTQRGNNNPYNQDNETTWLDWSRQQRFAELTEFVRDLLALRRSSPSIPVVLHGVDIAPDTGWESHSLAWQRGDLYVMANMWWEPLEFTVHAEGGWQIGLSSAPPVASGTDRFRLAPRSTVVLRRC